VISFVVNPQVRKHCLRNRKSTNVRLLTKHFILKEALLIYQKVICLSRKRDENDDKNRKEESSRLSTRVFQG
jgi:hypothetical protein